jgi:hypothetical protein
MLDMSPKTTEPDWPPVVRLSEPLRGRMARLREAMAKRLGVATLPPRVALQAVLERGLEALEPDYGLAAKDTGRRRG